MAINTHDTGFLCLLMGGSGALAAKVLRDFQKADGFPVPMYVVLIDTDGANTHLLENGSVDDRILIRLGAEQVQTVKSTPESFGGNVARIVSQVGSMLDPEEMENGARTTRSLAELPWEVHRNSIASQLNACIRDFLRLSGCKKIMPVGLTSSGGGTGSAFSILLAASLLDPAFRGRLLQGFPDGLLRSLILFVVEPYYRAFSHENDPNHTAKILANAMAFRIESEYLERQGGFARICHLGLSSPGGGAVLDTEREVSRVLGTAVFQYLRYWESNIKPRNVDRPLFDRYAGHDTPEYVRLRQQAAYAAGTNGQS